MKKGFDNNLYIKKQSESILKRIEQFDNKLYLEFGGKLFDDLHAQRVLPGFDANAKIKLLKKLKDKAEVIFCISSMDIIRNKIRADFGITYSLEAMRVIDNLRKEGILVSAIIITLFKEEPVVEQLKQKLELQGEKVYIHRATKGYPLDVNTIVSEEGYGQNAYIPTTRPLVIVTAPGPGSGKLATCLTQLYHEHKRGIFAGYAKYETFPVWNLPLSHPVNVAYEAATADLQDINMIDYFHLQANNERAVNYNRDLETFPVLNNILTRITGKEIYRSPTEMGVNMIASAITDDEVCCYAAKQEVLRRYYAARVFYKDGSAQLDTIKRLEFLMRQLSLVPADRPCVTPALEYERACGMPTCAIELEDGRIVTGKQSSLLTASSAAILNALKVLAGIKDEIKLLPTQIIQPIIYLNKNVYKSKRSMMTLEQVVIALAMSQTYNDAAALALKYLPALQNAQAHTTRILTGATQTVFRKLEISVTSEDIHVSSDLYTE